MQPLFFQSLRLLLTDYSPLSNTQPFSSFFSSSFFVAPPSASQTLCQQIKQEICVLVASSVFFFFSLFRVRLHLSPALRSRRSDRGVRKKKKKTMDLCTLFFYLLCLCFDASAATSLITGKTRAKKEHTGRARSLDSNVSPSLGSSWNAHNSVLDVLDIQANIFETKGRQNSEFLITILPFGIN